MNPTQHRDAAPPLLALVGPTAGGKSAVALELAGRFGAHVVNYDSVQLYRGLEIGSAKPTPEERSRFPHHLYDLGGPEEELSAGTYAKAAGELLEELLARGERVLLVGGTGLYLKALCRGLSGAPAADAAVRARIESRYAGEACEALHGALARVDPAAAGRIQPRDRYRLLRALCVFEQTGRPLSDWHEAHGFATERFSPVCIGLAADRQTLYKRIERRSRQMIGRGLLDEARSLEAMGYRPGGRALSSIGYRHALSRLAGETSEEEMLETLVRDTCRYAKRQMTWWRKDTSVRWTEAGQDISAAVLEATRIWEEGK